MNGYGTEHEYDEQMWNLDNSDIVRCDHVDCDHDCGHDCMCSPWYCGCSALPGGVHDCRQCGLPQTHCTCADDMEEMDYEECEHGLAAWLCEGSNHYPMDQEKNELVQGTK